MIKRLLAAAACLGGLATPALAQEGLRYDEERDVMVADEPVLRRAAPPELRLANPPELVIERRLSRTLDLSKRKNLSETGPVQQLTRAGSGTVRVIVNNELFVICDANYDIDQTVTTDHIFYSMLEAAWREQHRVWIQGVSFGKVDPPHGSVINCISWMSVGPNT